jgi:hypothetical protein
VDGALWLVDPLDAPDLDAALAARGPVAGVVVTHARHRRDAALLARRHGVPVWADAALGRLRLDAPLRRFRGRLPGTPLVSLALPARGRLRPWREAALWWPGEGVLVVGETVGTAGYFLLGGERLGLHPFRRPAPPRALAGLGARLLLVGHGDPVLSGAGPLLDRLAAGARRPPLWRARTAAAAVRAWRAARRGSRS